MPKFTQDQLNLMCRPASESEEAKLQNAEAMVKQALSSSSILSSYNYEIFGQGSYANNTNIRLNSDIDINVCYTGAFYYDVPQGKTGNDYGLNNPVSYSFADYKNDIENILVAYFGRMDIIRKNKCITVKGNTNRIQVDVVPTWKHRRYDSQYNTNFVEGVILFSDNTFQKITNYPKQHLANGINKNTESLRRFKRLARILKNIHVKMENDKYYTNENVTSFLLECLAYNIPTNIYVKANNCEWNDILRASIYYLWDNTKEDSTSCHEWGEVSELLYLLRGHKWTCKDVHDYMYWMWNYLDLK